MAAIGEPLRVGVIAGLAHPGGNVTGLSSIVADLGAKRIELIKEMVPGLVRLAVLLNMSNDSVRYEWNEIETGARAVGVQTYLLDVRKPEALGPAFEEASARRADAAIVALDAVMQANRQLITDLAMKHRLPVIYASREFVDAGGLIAYGVSYPDLYRRAATYVGKILKGVKPGELPVEQPTKFELVVNLRTARALGLSVPPGIVLRADELIE